MAFASRIGALVEELVEILTQSSAQADPVTVSAARDAALRRLKSHPYLRTNPFEVDSSLRGLEERFRINHRDGLADALRDRLSALRQHPAKWHPEVLYLLLELSDQPTLKTRLSDLEALLQEEEQEEAPLRWEDIAREDGWDQDASLWKSISHSDDSADDYEHDSSGSEATSAPGDEDAGRPAEAFITHPQDYATLESVQKAQEWRAQPPLQDSSGNARKVAVPEAQVVREVLFMLQGLECTLFGSRGATVPAFQLADVAWETHWALMGTFSEFGRQLRVLRDFVRQPQTVPHLQALQDCISRRLRALDSRLSEMQARLASPKDEVVVSLVRIKGELDPQLEPLFALSRTVAQVQEASGSETFRYLELMFDETCVAQFTGKPETYEFLARIFVECFNVYLRPIRHWMDEGKLLPGNELFFIDEPSSDVPLSDTWRRRFQLRKTADGRLHAPDFLQPAVGKIYNAGKNIVVLRLLGKHDATPRRVGEEPPLDYDVVCPRGLELAPFADVFGAAFDQWIQNKYRKTSTTLKDALFGDWGLSSALDALQALYLMSDGFAASSFAEGLFSKLDAAKPGWYDRYALTAAGREAFASHVDISRLSVGVDAAALRMPGSRGRESVKTALPSIEVSYRLPWPVQMIVTDESVAHYQSIFTLLLQLKRAAHALHKPRILDNYWTDHETWRERALFYSSRTRLLWFCTTIQTYLATLVLEPAERQMRRGLEAAEDMDAMIALHAGAIKQMIDQACLGSRLTPIREGILDVLDLAIKLERGRLRTSAPEGDGDRAYAEVLEEIGVGFDRHLRFICGGLRSVARASSSSQSAAKWDMLADMLEAGSDDAR